MTIQLILTLDGINEYYGNIPETFGHPNNYEEYEWDDEVNDYLENNFVDLAFKNWNSLLDYGDVDYYNVEQCKKLIPIISNEVKKVKNKKVANMYLKLLEFAKRAIELNTGIIIEM